MKKGKEKYNAPKVCSICTEEYTEYGNNAEPFQGRCCNRCDNAFVIPARILRMQVASKRQKEKSCPASP